MSDQLELNQEASDPKLDLSDETMDEAIEEVAEQLEAVFFNMLKHGLNVSLIEESVQPMKDAYVKAVDVAFNRFKSKLQ